MSLTASMTQHNGYQTMSFRPAHFVGETQPPLLEATIGQCLRDAARKWPDSDAVVFREQGARLTFAELEDRCGRFAQGLLDRGIRPGARVAIWAPNCVEWVIAQFGTALIGTILVCINPAYRREELRHALQLTDCAAIVTAVEFRGQNYIAMLRELVPAADEHGELRATSRELPSLRRLISIGPGEFEGFEPFDRLLASPPTADMARHAPSDPNEAVAIQFTSGTTGRPKGATLTHRNLVNNAYLCGWGQRFGEGEHICLPVPLYHCFAMVLGSLAGLVHGAAVVYPSAAFEPGATLAAIEEERCTAVYGVPTMFVGLLAHESFAQRDVSSLRTGIMGGAPCPPELMRRAISDMNMRDVTICFGMTETSPTSFQTSPDDSIERRVQTVGRVIPHAEARIVRADGSTAEIGEAGEIAVRGPSVMLGYWRQPEATAEVIVNGWMMTGDLGILDESGYLQVVGRRKELIIRGGENVYPREVEDVLFAHPEIEQAYVFGVEDARLGEEVCAWILQADGASLTAEDITAYCRDRLAFFKVPRHVRFVSAFPMTVTGKVQKFVMQQEMRAALS